jgi:4-amino-4-deoxy-L-arabinose transferase-like glycosyltransferase
MRNKVYLTVFLVILFGSLIRLLFLDKIPAGLAQDETSIGYNAYSILKTGKDEYGIRMPVFFKAFGDYKLPVYIYLSVLSIKIFGLNEWGVRIPSAIFGSLTLILYFFVLRELFPQKKHLKPVVLSLLVLSVNPWHIFFSRAAFEVIPALFFMLSGFYLLLKGNLKNTPWLYAFSVILFGVSAYTYNICRLLSPVIFTATFLFIKKDSITKVIFKHYILIFFSALVTFFPYLLSLSQSTKGLTGTFLFTNIVNRIFAVEFRSYVWLKSPWLARIFTPIPVLLLWEYIRNILLYLSGSFFFVNGPEHLNHTLGINGLFYPFEVITIIVGIVTLLKLNKSFKLLILWTVSTIFISAATREAPFATRSFFLIFPLTVFSGFGITRLFEKIVTYKNKYLKFLYLMISLILLYLSFVPVVFSYLYRFPVVYAKNWRSTEKNVALFIKNKIDEYDGIVIDPNSTVKYTTLLFYLAYPPDKFLHESKRAPDTNEGFSNVLSFGKIRFGITWHLDLAEKNNLIITSANDLPLYLEACKKWSYPTRPVVVNNDEKIAVSFIDEAAFSAVDTNTVISNPDGSFVVKNMDQSNCLSDQ